MKKQCKGKMMKHRKSLMHTQNDRHPQFVMDKDEREEALERVSLWSDEGFEKD